MEHKTRTLNKVHADIMPIIEGWKEKITYSVMPFGIVKEVLDNLGFESEYPDTNGWEIDYWATFKKANTIISVYGSMYSGECVIKKELKYDKDNKTANKS